MQLLVGLTSNGQASQRLARSADGTLAKHMKTTSGATVSPVGMDCYSESGRRLVIVGFYAAAHTTGWASTRCWVAHLQGWMHDDPGSVLSTITTI